MHTELARIIVNLRPSVLDDLGLAAAIGWLADRLRATGVTVHCELEGIEARLSPEIETALFRAVQEALSNIARHARAETVLIQGVRRGDHITFEIEDDGIGFETGTAVEGLGSMRGVGLLGMRERIEIIGGTLAIESEPGSGTRVVMNVPTETA
jgi:signal transduction histidine kinase